MSRNQTALIIIRAWVEPGSSEPLRAHIRLTSDIQAGFESEVTVAGMTKVIAAVQLWLEEVMAAEKAC